MAFWNRHTGSAEYLTSVGFFEGFTDEELARVAELGTEVEVAAGVVVMDQGAVGQDCYVLVEGSLSVYIGGEHVATLPPGSMVGEMALVDHRPRRATVVTDVPSKLLGFDTKRFRTLLDEMPKARDRVLGLLAARLKPQPAS